MTTFSLILKTNPKLQRSIQGNFCIIIEWGNFVKPIRVKLSAEANKYFENLSPKIKSKFLVSFDKLEAGFKGKWFEHLEDEIWEFRQRDQSKFYRIFAFWDKTQTSETLVIATHGLDKKSNKTPRSEINKAKRIRQNYFREIDKNI